MLETSLGRYQAPETTLHTGGSSQDNLDREIKCFKKHTMSREQGLEQRNTIRVGDLNATKESGVEVGSDGRVAVSAGCNSGVNTGGVAVPDLEVRALNGVAGGDVQDLEVEGESHTDLILGNVLADILSGDVVGTLGNLGREHAGAVAREEGRLGGVQGVVLSRVVSAIEGGDVAGCGLMLADFPPKMDCVVIVLYP